VECKLRCVNFRRILDPTRAFRQALGVTGISEDWYRITMEVIVISLKTSQSTRENFGCTWEHLGVLATSFEAPVTSLGALRTYLGALMSSMGAPGSASDKPGSTSNHSKAVCEK